MEIAENRDAEKVNVTVTVRYFAILKDQRGLTSEKVSTEAATLSALYNDLAAAHGFSLKQNQLRVALNDKFVDWQEPLAEGAQVVFIPPVAGG